MKKLLLLLLCFALIMGQSYAQKWDAIFQGSTYQGSPVGSKDMIEFNGDLYVAGTWNPALETYIAKWDGTDWTAAGSGFVENVGSAIYALEVFNGELYAGGQFNIDIGGAIYSGLAKWDGTNWSAVDSRNFGFVRDLATYNGILMIGGDFYLSISGSQIENIIGYNGTNMVDFNQGVMVGDVWTIEEHNNELYIAGEFTKDKATNSSINKMAKWDGVNGVWVPIGSPFPSMGFSSYFIKLKSYGSHLYIYYLHGYGKLARWDLNTELVEINSVSTSPNSNLLNFDDMIVFGGNLVVAGSFWNTQVWPNTYSPVQIESYDGTSWNKALVGGASATALGVYNGKLTTGTYSLQDPSVEFTADNTQLCAGESVTFSYSEVSSNPITSFTWTFEGGTPATSTEPNPVVSYANNGNYKVSLEVTSVDGTNTITKSNFIVVTDEIVISQEPVDASACEEVGNVSFSFRMNYGSNIIRQWQVDDGTGFVDIGGNITSLTVGNVTTLTLIPSLDKNGNKYRCKITRCGNEVFTSEATLTVNETPKIISQPV